MLTLLLPVDGSAESERAVLLAMRLHRVTPVDICLLHVVTDDAGIGIAAGARQGGVSDAPSNGDRALSPVRALLDAQGIPYASEVKRGFVPATIVEHARSLGCHGIVMGTRGMGTTDALLGSIARQVIQLADVPVTLVK
jgi:nucleotide-binding universal stress UspA family protein